MKAAVDQLSTIFTPALYIGLRRKLSILLFFLFGPWLHMVCILPSTDVVTSSTRGYWWFFQIKICCFSCISWSRGSKAVVWSVQCWWIYRKALVHKFKFNIIYFILIHGFARQLVFRKFQQHCDVSLHMHDNHTVCLLVIHYISQ